MPDTGFLPVISSQNAWWTDPDNAFSSDDVYTITHANQGDRQRWSIGVLDLPDGASVVGVEMTIEGKLNSGAVAGNGISARFSPTNGNDWSDSKSTSNFTASETTKTLGGPTDLWGLSASLFNETFSFNVGAMLSINTTNLVDVDQIMVKVYYIEDRNISSFDAIVVAESITMNLVHNVVAGKRTGVRIMTP